MIQVELSKSELLEAMRNDCVTFFVFYLQDELTLEVPEFHQEIWDELLEAVLTLNQPDFLIGHLQKLFAVPREHSKSTISKLAVILFMRYSPLAFTLYVSKTNTVAMNALKDVVAWLRSPQEEELYGAPIIIKANETESIWIIEIGLPGGGRKRITLKAIGATQQVRGTLIDNKRPELVILDDIEDLDTADGDVQQRKLDEWTLGSLMKATARRSFRIFIGNMVRSTTLLARLSKDPDWNPTVFGSLVRDKETGLLKALWEGRWTVEALLADYRKYRRLGLGHIWEAEMMNLSKDLILTRDLGNAVRPAQPDPEDVECGFICLDPAFGKEAWHDESAITVHVRVKGVDLPILVETRHGRWGETRVLDELVELSYYWNLNTWTIEAVAAQRLLIPLFTLLLKDRLIPEGVFTMLPIQAGKESKGSRITGFRDIVAERSYAVSENQDDLIGRLESYSPDAKTHDDVCDSAAYGPIVWKTYGSVVESQGSISIAGRLMGDGSNQAGNYGERDVCTI